MGKFLRWMVVRHKGVEVERYFDGDEKLLLDLECMVFFSLLDFHRCE